MTNSYEIGQKGVTVNGKFHKDLTYQICTRCVQDSTVPGITFDEHGECNFCKLWDTLDGMFPNGEKGKKILDEIIAKIKAAGKGKKFDVAIGISGGRDSIYLLWKTVKEWGLRPIAVHFNDGFDNPVAGENMINACKKLGVELRTITSDWREAKQLKIDFLKASTPDLNLGTDIGIASAIFGVANKEDVKYIMIGQSFRTEGIKPLSWAYFDGDYLKKVHYIYSDLPLRKWTPNDPGFNFGVKELAYYTMYKGIRTFTPMYYSDYHRPTAEKIITEELDWVYPGAHYFDDLYHSLIKYIHRIKFGIDMNMNSDSALVRSGQLDREVALSRAHGIYSIEDPKVIQLCIKRLGLTQEEFDSYMALPCKDFHDMPTSYPLIKLAKPIVWAMSQMNLLPKVVYLKYYKHGR